MRTPIAFVTAALVGALASCQGSVPCLQSAECGAGNLCISGGACAPKCQRDAQCKTASERCSAVGACVPKTGCGGDADCAASKGVCEAGGCVSACTPSSCGPQRTCKSDGHCGGGAVLGADGGPKSCGGQLFTAAPVESNFLIVLDRSGSMEEPLAAGSNKWDTATAALKAVTSANQATVRFGLSMFPGNSQCNPGGNVVPVGPAQAGPIAQALPQMATGMGTPIGAALTGALGVAELKDPQRANFVLLLTDGAENCQGNPEEAVRQLFAAGIRTYAVGFGDAVNVGNLNRVAVAGGTARLGATKYYQADDVASLQAALSGIATGATQCDFKLAQAPADVSKLFVAINGGLVPEDPARLAGWAYTPATQRLTLYGPACDLVVQNPGAQVQVIYGCPDDTLIEKGPSGDGGYWFQPDSGVIEIN